MVVFLMTMAMSIKIGTAAPASQIEGTWVGEYIGLFYGGVYDFSFKGDSVKIKEHSCNDIPYTCLKFYCVDYYIIGLFKQTMDSIIITGNYADSNFIVNTNLNGCADGPYKVGTFTWKLSCKFTSDTIFFLNYGGDGGPDKLIRKTTGTINHRGLVFFQNAFSNISALISNAQILLNNSGKSNNLYVKIFDCRGKLVFSQKGSANMLIPDKFQSGIYYLSVCDNNRVLLKKQFVVNR
jgi:hypothetical protein